MITQRFRGGEAKWAVRVSATLAAAVLASVIAGPASAEETIDCPDYRVYGAAGTNAVNHELADDDEDLLGTTTLETAAEIKRLLEIEGETVDLRGIDYPAVIFGYSLSVLTGVNTLADMIDDFVEDCSSSRIILVGYSQGGDLVATYARGRGDVDTPHRDKIAGVAVLGDPSFNPEDYWADRGTYSEIRAGYWTPNIRGLYEPKVSDRDGVTRPGVSGDRIPWKDLSHGTSQ